MENRKFSPKTLLVAGVILLVVLLLLIFSPSSGPEPLNDMDQARILEQVIRLEQNQAQLIQKVNSLSGWMGFRFLTVLNLGFWDFSLHAEPKSKSTGNKFEFDEENFF